MRRYDLDWLRVIVFGLLIFYHVGMFFVPWGFHIKNNQIYDWLIYPMYFLNQWRLPLLFLISGMGTFYAFSRRTYRQFAGERIKRLFIPLIVGMAFIIPPQVYFERVANGQFTGSYFDFWPSYAYNGVYPEGNLSWHHLWFLPYLLFYSLLLIPVFRQLRKNPDNALFRLLSNIINNPFSLYLLIIPLYLWESLLEPFFPSTHAFIGDWFNIVNYLTLFFYGFLLISVKDAFWENVTRYRSGYLWAGLIGFSLLLLIVRGLEDSIYVHFIEALVKVFNLWSWILAIFGYAAVYLNRSGKVLSYANEAVYPFYILHQTITIALGFYLMSPDWNFGTKFTIMILGTFGISFLLYEFLIRRWRWIRPLFGMRNRK
jgi:glucans biosynthesis protein C